MTIQTFPRALVDSSLRIARLPLDGILRFGGDSASVGSARIFLDRLDATVREVAGTMLRDDVLVDDGQRRQAAADEREHAERLHAEAEFHSEQGDLQVQEARREAEARRRKADQEAKERRREAQKRRASKKSATAKSTQARKQSADRTARKRKQAIGERGQHDRLDAVETKADALELKQMAMTAADESKRLNETASRAKQRRKRS